MRKRTLGAVLITGLALSAGGAFTASNTVPTSTAGYGANSVTGATVNDIDYTLNTIKDSVSIVTFTAAEVLTGKNVDLRLLQGTTSVALASTDTGAANACVVTVSVVACTFATPVALESFNNLAITVYDKD